MVEKFQTHLITARVGFALHAGAWVFVQDHLGRERTVFDVIAWIIESIHS